MKKVISFCSLQKNSEESSWVSESANVNILETANSLFHRLVSREVLRFSYSMFFFFCLLAPTYNSEKICTEPLQQRYQTKTYSLRQITPAQTRCSGEFMETGATSTIPLLVAKPNSWDSNPHTSEEIKRMLKGWTLRFRM